MYWVGELNINLVLDVGVLERVIVTRIANLNIYFQLKSLFGETSARISLHEFLHFETSSKHWYIEGISSFEKGLLAEEPSG